MDLEIRGKKALIGGGTRGIGRSVAETLAAEGVNLEIIARHSSQEVAKEISKKFGITSHGHDFDLSKDDVISLKKEIGNIDILFANAGGPKPGEMEDLDNEDWRMAYDLTLMSVVKLTRAFLPGMISKGWGRVIALTSISVFEPISRLLLSNSIRMAVEGLIRSLSVQHASSGVTFNCVAPGYTLTDRVKKLFEDTAKIRRVDPKIIENEIAERPDIKRLARPFEIANAIAFLVSERASYITGTTLKVDGGYVKSSL